MRESIPIKNHAGCARTVRARVQVGVAMVLVLCGVLLSQLLNLQIVNHHYYSTQAEKNRIQIQPIPPTRGLIYDRNGEILANNLPSFSLTVVPERLGDNKAEREEVVDKIVRILSLNEEEKGLILKRMAQAKRAFEKVPVMFQMNEDHIARIALNQYQLPGVDITTQMVREYPMAEHFAHSIGYVSRINEAELQKLDKSEYSGTMYIGKTGIEKFYEKVLHGNVGYEEVETNARGRVTRILNRVEPTSGMDLTLHIDNKLQQIAEAALEGRRGAIIAIDPKSGGVLAMASQPSFDPNLFVGGISFKAYAKLRDSPERPLFNRVLQAVYPPGSTIKPLVALAALNAGVITPNSRVFDPGYYRLPRNAHKFRNWNHRGDGWVSLQTAIMRSNDTYFYDTSLKLGVKRLHDSLKAMGLGRRVAYDLSGESSGLMPSDEWKRKRYKKSWYPGETLILGIGQGYMQSTPLQLAHAAAFIANRGKWIQPRLLKVAGQLTPEQLAAKDLIAPPPTPPDVLLKNWTYWDTVEDGMEMVLHHPRGTAYKVGSKAAYRIAGKSGTAQVVGIKQGERYNRGRLLNTQRDHALFLAYAPVQNPQIAVAVMVENGESGSGVAAPMVKKVMDAWLLDDKGQLKPEYAAPMSRMGQASR